MKLFKKRTKHFTFTSTDTPEALCARIRDTVEAHEMRYEETPEGFYLGLEPEGHHEGNWLRTTVTATEQGTEIRGKLVVRRYHDDDEYREDTKWEAFWSNLGTAVILILFCVPLLLFFAILGIIRLFARLAGKAPDKVPTTEEQLVHFMTEVLGCEKK